MEVEMTETGWMIYGLLLVFIAVWAWVEGDNPS
jgi:hypothetical protein